MRSEGAVARANSTTCHFRSDVLMTHSATPSNPSAVAAFGFAATLERRPGLFASFTPEFACVSIATGIFTTYSCIFKSSGARHMEGLTWLAAIDICGVEAKVSLRPRDFGVYTARLSSAVCSGRTEKVGGFVGERAVCCRMNAARWWRGVRVGGRGVRRLRWGGHAGCNGGRDQRCRCVRRCARGALRCHG